MQISKSLNALRRILMRKLTRNIGTTSYDPHAGPIDKTQVKRILISRPNKRLGNLLLITPLLQEVLETFPQSKIDLFVRGGLAPILFRNYENIDRIMSLPGKPFKQLGKFLRGWMTLKRTRYDIVINVMRNSSSGRLSVKFANAKYKFFGDTIEDLQSKHPDHEHIAKFPVYNFRSFLSLYGLPESEKPVGSIDLRLTASEIAEGKKILRDLVNNDRKTISIFTYATGDKCYPEAWWETFYTRLKSEYPEYNIVEILPMENISKIAFKAPSFYSKDVREIGSVIANTEVFIGADSGIMHLASASLTPTVGLFSVTNENVYAPYNNNSVGINTEKSGIDLWIDAIDKIFSKRPRNLSRKERASVAYK